MGIIMIARITPGGQHTDAIGRSAEEAGPAQRFGEKRLDRHAQDGDQHEDCPEPIDHAGDGSQKFGGERKNSPQPDRGTSP